MVDMKEEAESMDLREGVGEEAPEFWPECRCPYYAVPTGSPSCYGAEMAATLATLARDGQVKPANISARAPGSTLPSS